MTKLNAEIHWRAARASNAPVLSVHWAIQRETGSVPSRQPGSSFPRFEVSAHFLTAATAACAPITSFIDLQPLSSRASISAMTSPGLNAATHCGTARMTKVLGPNSSISNPNCENASAMSFSRVASSGEKYNGLAFLRPDRFKFSRRVIFADLLIQ